MFEGRPDQTALFATRTESEYACPVTVAVPRIYILAGPNGAGKTTFAREFLVREGDCPAFINADLIAEGVSPFAPARAAVRAGRIMLELIKDAVRKRESFAFETTLADRTYARFIRNWREAGYTVRLHCLSLPSADFAIARVAERVRQGGHDIPEEVIRRRFAVGRRNFETLYKPIVNTWTLYDSAPSLPIIVDHGEKP